MSKRIDISNQIFGNWYVNRYLDNSEYDCTCMSCNRHFRVSSYKLRNGTSTSCSECLARLKGDKNREKLEGQKILGWTVEKYLGNTVYVCKNDLNVYRAFTTHQLKHNKHLTCDIDNKCNIELYMIIGRLTLIEYIGNSVYYCICNCGNKHFILENDLINGINTMCENCSNISSNKLSTWKNEILDRIKELDFTYENGVVTLNHTGATIILYDKDCELSKKEKQNKRILYLKQNRRLIYIFEHEWKNLDKKDKLIDLIYRAAKANRFKKVYARKLDVIIPETNEVKEFESKYHLQGYSQANINLGFKYNDELIALMTFGSARFRGTSQYEMIRLVYKNDVIVVGGPEKLFKYFIDNFNPESIVSFCDISKFDGAVYGRLGFDTVEAEITSPNYCWVNSDCTVALPRYKTMKHKLIAQGLGTTDDTEDSIMIRAGFTKVYDCGNIKFIWSK